MSRPGDALISERTRSGVPSVEDPSTNRISVRVPMSGVRRTSPETLSASLRHGMTTVQLRDCGTRSTAYVTRISGDVPAWPSTGSKPQRLRILRTSWSLSRPGGARRTVNLAPVPHNSRQ